MKLQRRDLQSVEIQMGPMIDMVFLLLVFFMVTAKPVKQESDVGLSLPGTVSQEETLEIPDEQQIAILADGSVVLNELVVGSAGDVELRKLVGILTRFKEAADANRAEALVTISPADAVPHQRVLDVLNACAQARITGVTFSDEPDGGTM
jgi:biopolymer transport protein ExbD